MQNGRITAQPTPQNQLYLVPTSKITSQRLLDQSQAGV